MLQFINKERGGVMHPLLVNVIADHVRGEKKWTEGPRDYGMKGININAVITDL